MQKLMPIFGVSTRCCLSTSSSLCTRSTIRVPHTSHLRHADLEGNPLGDPEGPRSDNDKLSTHVRNRNPLNLDQMRISLKPRGFSLERRERGGFWNRLDLKISHQHTTAEVTHWTGRKVCSASTREWSIRRFLYNTTDAAAVEVVAKVIGQRCLETGVLSVYLKKDESEEKEKMLKFVDGVKKSGVVIGEGPEYHQEDPHRNLMRWEPSLKPWEYPDE